MTTRLRLRPIDKVEGAEQRLAERGRQREREVRDGAEAVRASLELGQSRLCPVNLAPELEGVIDQLE